MGMDQEWYDNRPTNSDHEEREPILEWRNCHTTHALIAHYRGIHSDADISVSQFNRNELMDLIRYCLKQLATQTNMELDQVVEAVASMGNLLDLLRYNCANYFYYKVSR